MERDCENCKYSDIDYIFDEETGDEYPIYTCEKGNDVSLDYECKDFKEYKPKPYKEEFSECDYCQYVSSCGNVIESTTRYDTQRHFINRISGYCRKESGLLDDKSLSEIISIADKLEFLDTEKAIETLNKAIDKFGNITFKELMKGKIYEMYEH